MSKQRDQIIQAAQGKVPEQLLGAAFGKPRGASVAQNVGITGAIGQNWAGRQDKGAAAAGMELGTPGAIAVTPTSLVTMQVGVSLTGKIKEVEQVLSVVPLAAVDSIEVSQFGFAGVMAISIGGSVFKLEGKPGDMREFVADFDRARAAAR